MARLYVFITGQYRTFWVSWKNLVEMVLKQARHLYEIHVCVGIDFIWQMDGFRWQEKDRTLFHTHLKNEWEEVLQLPPEHLMFEWIGHDNEFFNEAIVSLKKYMDEDILDPEWFNYLIYRSGSCIEYAQIVHLYERVCEQYTIQDDDLMMRTRTDTLLRHPIDFNSLPPSVGSPTKEVFENLFPASCHFKGKEETVGREFSIFPSQPVSDKWVITLRKNLIYILPLKAGSLLREVVQHYGDWDTINENTYWFNAESQFRGCFRCHDFTLWEYSQDKDSCYEGFENNLEDFPIYAIHR